MAPVIAQVMMTFLGPAMGLVRFLELRRRFLPSGADLAVGLALLGGERHQPAVPPDLPLFQLVGGQALAAIALDLLDHRARPVDAPLLRLVQALINALI